MHESYYSFQTEARGLRSSGDVKILARAVHPVYSRLFANWIPENRSIRIYEAACGPGLVLSWFDQNGYKNVSGSDSSTEQIALATSLGLSAHVADSIAEIESFEPDSLDTIIGIDFYEHLPKDVFLVFLSASARALKPGGSLILRGPNGDSPLVGRNLFNDITHHWAYTTIALGALFRMSGFSSADFLDDALVGIQRHRWIKYPVTFTAHRLLRLFLLAATRERVLYLGPSIYSRARKADPSDDR